MNHDQHEHIPLTAAEISNLWTTFQYATSSICEFEYFLVHIDDNETRQLLEESLALSKENKEKIIHLFNKENYPIPQGFTEQDVNLNAPRLFSDKLYLEYVLILTKFEIVSYGMSLMQSARSDITEFFNGMLKDTQNFHIKAKELSKDKGLLIRVPIIPKPNKVEYVKNNSFTAGWFGERRPLLGTEITYLVSNARRNALGQAVITGFSQVANLKEVRQFFERGRDISGKHLHVFGEILYEDYLPEAALLQTSEVTDSTVAPFSDKLMMNLITTLIGVGMADYGLAMSLSPRHDLGLQYTRLIAQVAKYSNDGAKILIDNGWMEQPPMAADRKGLAK